jgi:hypothetical protein
MMTHLDELVKEYGATLAGDAIGCGVIKWELRACRNGVEYVYEFLASEETAPKVLLSNMIIPYLRTHEMAQ